MHPEQTLLVVCAANVCRSPLSEFLLDRSLRELSGFDGIVVSSAGVSAREGSEICERVRGSEQAEGFAAFAAAHRSRPISAAMIEGASLILTASMSERAAVASLAPAARPRTFTLREAAALALVPGFSDEAALEERGALDRFASIIHGRRGFAEPARRSTGLRLFGRPKSPAEPFDIVDGHSLGSQAHDRTIRQVGLVVEALTAAMPSVVFGRTS